LLLLVIKFNSPLVPRSLRLVLSNRAVHTSASIGIELGRFGTSDRSCRLSLLVNIHSKKDDLNADRDLYSGLIRLHVLHHTVKAPVFGLRMLEELASHGYRISPGTLYSLLHGLERKGYLKASQERNGKSRRTVYRAHQEVKRALGDAKRKVRELFTELVEEK